MTGPSTAAPARRRADVGHPADAGAPQEPPDEIRLRQLADEQAALRRVATLVAGGARPGEVFTAVADELGRLIGAEATFVSGVDLSGANGPGSLAAGPSRGRGELEGYGTVLGSYGRVSGELPVGLRVKLPPGSVITPALRTGRPARVKSYATSLAPGLGFSCRLRAASPLGPCRGRSRSSP